MESLGSAVFNTGLLTDLRNHDIAGDERWLRAVRREDVPADYHVLASRTRGIYNLGGNLGSFRR